MSIPFPLENEECPVCGAEELHWWSKDESETVIEVYMNCLECETNFPKVIVEKFNDTSESALKSALKEKWL